MDPDVMFFCSPFSNDAAIITRHNTISRADGGAGEWPAVLVVWIVSPN